MNQSNTPSRKPHKPSPTEQPSDASRLHDQNMAGGRREFVREMAKKAAYVAPVVIALTANKTAFASASGAPS